MWKLTRLLTVLRKELLLAWGLLRDPRTPKSAKLATVLAIVYVLSPIDLIPDTIPLLGWLDDGLLAYVLLQLAFKLLPAELHAALRAKVDARVKPAAR
ncbi:YkvA family protein [Ottowia pentelensis]|uniref:YkvA family protein n=1 Tax=Ottowia pentelensis TaxID=511108 RepID=A0ABV6PN61_9BURK